MSGTGLNPSDVVSVTVTLSPIAAGERNFGTCCIAGATDVIDVQERIRQYSDLSGVGQDFGTTAPEYLAAELWFGQVPPPATLNIGRWAKGGSAGIWYGAGLNATQQGALETTLSAINNGGFLIYVYGVPCAVTGMDFSAILNLSGAAGAITAAMAASVTQAQNITCTWEAAQGRFRLEDSHQGQLTDTVGPVQPPTAVGQYTFNTQPDPGDTITLDGTAVSFVASGATGNEVNIGGSTAATVAATRAFLNASTDPNIATMTYISQTNGLNLYCVAKTPGAGGNSLTIAKSSSHIVVSGATLAGGNATDVATPCEFLASLGAYAVPPIAAETPVQAAAILLGPTVPFNSYAFAFAPAAVSDISDAQYEAVAGFIQANSPPNVAGFTTQEATTLVPSDTTDLAYALQQLGYSRIFTQYSGNNLYAAVSALARAATVDFDGTNTTITLKFKQEPGVTPEILTETQAASLTAKNCNVYATYSNGRSILQQGVMANGFFFDEVQGTDWLQNAVQIAVFNLLFETPTKIPQTDAGVHQIVTAIADTLEQGVNNGLIGPGLTWTGPPMGPTSSPVVKTGQVLPAGYAIYQPPVSIQSAADRAARKSPVLQVAVCLAGAIHSVSVLINVVR